MTTEQLKNLTRQNPFKPFRLIMSDGRHYDVRHPELLTPGKSVSSLGVVDKYDETGLADHFVWLDNAHITTTIPIAIADQLG